MNTQEYYKREMKKTHSHLNYNIGRLELCVECREKQFLHGHIFLFTEHIIMCQLTSICLFHISSDGNFRLIKSLYQNAEEVWSTADSCDIPPSLQQGRST
jgi:hypothetical protein